MTKKTYLRAPNLDYEPDKAIQLGHVWRKPQDPGSFIGTPLLIPDEIKINHSYKSPWTTEKGRESHGIIGIWLRFLQAVGVWAEGSISWDSADDASYSFPKMDTYSIEPTPDYVKASVATVEAEVVRSADNLYMITGVKIARSAKGSESAKNNLAVNAKAGLDGTPAGADATGGPKFNVARGRYNIESFGESSDVVFAYRVREIFYEKGVFKSREYNKGAVHGEGLVSMSEGDGAVARVSIESAELGDDDVVVEGEVYPFVDADGEECDFII